MIAKILAVLGLSFTLAQAVSAHPESHLGSRSCAVVYQGENFTGSSLRIWEGAHISNLSRFALEPYSSGTWNNRVSSLYVAPSCHLVGFQYGNFGREYGTGRFIGQKSVFHHGQYEYVGAMNNLMSSVICSCH